MEVATMTRSEAPTFEIQATGKSHDDRERAERLVLFSSTLDESPAVMAMILHKAGTASRAIEIAKHPDVAAYGQRPDARDEAPYTHRAAYTIGSILVHQDSDHVTFDRETQAAFERAMRDDQTEYAGLDERVDARELMVWQVFADEVVRFQTLGAAPSDTPAAA